MKVSIVIPTMNLDLTKKCVLSLINYTNLDDKEIIIVSNGADERIKEYINNLNNDKIPIRCKWFDKPLGAVKALNEGIKESTGEFVLLLNDDCEILPSEKSKWIDSLLQPFYNDPLMACTGPYRMHPMLGKSGLSLKREDLEYGFILFFCAVIKKEFFDKIGLLDEQLKCAVDIDFCLKLKNNGYKIQQVPKEDLLSRDEENCIGDFPIWHKAEATVHDFYGLDEWNKILKEDKKILEKRYNENRLDLYKKISIVIPVYGNHLEDFKKCWESILTNTYNMENIEVVIVANGCVEEYKNYLDNIVKINNNYKYLWFDESLGATLAINECFANSTGEYIVLLNQDVIILGSNWLNYLIEPFNDPKVGITGPSLGNVDENNRNFVLFFCAAIRRNVLNDIGILDPIFNPGGFEDIDFSIRAENAGWKLVQVPDFDSNTYMSSGNFFTGSFPIYHIEHHHEWMLNENFEKNKKILLNRYPLVKNKYIEVTWPCAQKKFELKMIQEFLKKEKLKKVLEVGTYRGGTAMLWAHLVEPNNGKVFCCDVRFDWGTFQDHGYVESDETVYHRQVYNNSHYQNFIEEFQGDSHDLNFIKKVKDKVGTVDLLFIDGDHSYEGVKQDFENFFPLVKLGGYIAFHDIVDSLHHRSNGCFVAPFWNEIKDIYPSWEFIDKNEYPGCPSDSMGIGIIKKDRKDLKSIIKNDNLKTNSGKNVICNICTKNRYDSTLHLAIQSVIMQTVKPDALLIYDDNTDEERIDLRENETYQYLFNLLDLHNIKWKVVFGLKQGQHHGHQIANKSKYKFVWRLDDDEIASPDTLEKLLSHMKDDVGAVGGLIITPGINVNENGSGELKDLYSKPNVQWNLGSKVLDVQHLHSSFLYRSNIVDYCLELSPVAHREETIFTYELYRKGYKLIVDQNIITYHLKQRKTGIRSNNSEWFYKHDEAIFRNKLESWGYKTILLNCGLGDHFAFLNVLPKLKEKWKYLIIGICYPEVFYEHHDITLTSISQLSDVNNDNIYKWMIDNNWKKSIVEAFEKYYEV